MEIRARRVVKYLTEAGRCPFDDWFENLRDKKTQAIVATRLNRVAQGNFGFCKRLGRNLWELKIDFGKGLRIYFAEDGQTIVVLLSAGDKSTQSRDVKKAQDYWADYCKE